MITHPSRSPVVTCPDCEQPFKLTDTRLNEAVRHSIATRIAETEGAPLTYKCPHCAKRSTQAELMGEDVEPFDASSTEDDEEISTP